MRFQQIGLFFIAFASIVIIALGIRGFVGAGTSELGRWYWSFDLLFGLSLMLPSFLSIADFLTPSLVKKNWESAAVDVLADAAQLFFGGVGVATLSLALFRREAGETVGLLVTGVVACFFAYAIDAPPGSWLHRK